MREFGPGLQDTSTKPRSQHVLNNARQLAEHVDTHVSCQGQQQQQQPHVVLYLGSTIWAGKRLSAHCSEAYLQALKHGETISGWLANIP